jgi:hypothetical protein
MLDVRLGRWFSTDPVTQPCQSPYCSMDNNPILLNDPLGDYSKLGAKIRNFFYGGDGVSYSEVTGEWGYEKGQDGGAKYSDGLSKAERQVKIDKFNETHVYNEKLGGWIKTSQGSISEYKPTLTDNWSSSKNIIGKTSYSIVNSMYTVPQIFTNPFTGGYYSLNGEQQERGSSELIDNFTFGVSSLVPTSSVKYAMGPLKNWIRVGTSYSIKGGFETFAIRWGAGGKFWKNIPSKSLQNANKQLREIKVPGDSWRTADPGHLHIYKK